MYTRISVFRDWINETISRNRVNDDTDLFNMPNNIDTSNELEIWWDHGASDEAEDQSPVRRALFIACVFLVLMKIK